MKIKTTETGTKEWGGGGERAVLEELWFRKLTLPFSIQCEEGSVNRPQSREEVQRCGKDKTSIKVRI